MFVIRVSVLLSFIFIFFLHIPFLSYANTLPINDSPAHSVDSYSSFNTNFPSPNTNPSTPNPRKRLTFGRVNTIATGLILVITLLNIVVFKLRELQEANLAEELNSLSSSPSERSCRRFSLSEILLATSNFSEELVLGRGGFGKVYKGFIDDGKVTVAIKRLNHKSKQGAREFWNEIEMPSKFRHSHLVSLIGYCHIGKEMIIVYEYMVNGTLADHLHKNSMRKTLSWVERLKICIGAAHGLNYLHTGTGVIDRVIHRDVKSSNILLDENWAAKISDFGISKIGPANTSVTHVSTNVKGSFGYLDPEYLLTRKLTRRSDVYSFGVVLFEVLCGRPVIDLRLNDEQRGLAGWAQQNVKEGTLDQIIDPSLRGQILPNSLMKFEEIADQCLQMFSKDRPTMAEVVVSLENSLILQERVDSFDYGDFFIENLGSSDAEEGIVIDLNNDVHEEAQMGEIVQANNATRNNNNATRNDHPRAKPIKNRELQKVVRQAFFGIARVISGNKLPKKAKKTYQQFDSNNNKGEMLTSRNKKIDCKGVSSGNKEMDDEGVSSGNKEMDGEGVSSGNKEIDGKGVSSGNKEIDDKGVSSGNKEATSTNRTWTREEKVKRIFQYFDTSRDASLGAEEMKALIVAVNPGVKFSDGEMIAILDEVFHDYYVFYDGKGLNFDGLLRIYNTGAGDLDRDFKLLGLELQQETEPWYHRKRTLPMQYD